MQSFEALISLMVFVSILAFVLAADPGPKPLDDSLYRMQLAEDAWRVMYLRGDLRDFGPKRRDAIEADMAKIGDEAGLCLFIKGIEFTNCRDKEPHENIASLKRTIIMDEGPRSFTFTISTISR